VTASMVVSTLASVPGNIAFYFVITLLIFGCLLWYALYKKGDVRAVVSHGKTVFELEAKERQSLGWEGGFFAMRNRQAYKGFVIEADTYELRGGGFSVEFFVEDHTSAHVDVTQFHVPNTFATKESAIEAAMRGGRDFFAHRCVRF